MDYHTLKIKIPRPRRSWFRYRVRTFLVLMMMIAIGATAWNLRMAGTKQRLMRRLERSKMDRDAALQLWKRAASAMRRGEKAADEEAEARSKYFKYSAEIEDLLGQLAANPS